MPEKFEPYSYEKAREEGDKMEAKIKSGEARDYAEAEQMVEAEKELSPEIIEKVMGKVRDINEFNTAFSNLGPMWPGIDRKKLLRNVLEEGLLGFTFKYRNTKEEWEAIKEGKYFNKERWARETRATHRGQKEEDSMVWFQIVGRGPKSLKRGMYISNVGEDGLSVNLIFNLSAFKEVPNTNTAFDSRPAEVVGKLFNRTYQAAHPGVSFINKEGKRKTRPTRSDEYSEGSYAGGRPKLVGEYVQSDSDLSALASDGWFTNGGEYVLFSRIAPRFFTGISVGIYKKGEPETYFDIDYKRQERKTWVPEIDEDVIKRRGVAELAGVMQDVFRDKQEMLVPIYDLKGNLLWPKKMGYEGVKQFVADRDARKATSQ